MFSAGVTEVKRKPYKPDDLRRHPDENQTKSAALKKTILHHYGDPLVVAPPPSSPIKKLTRFSSI